MRGTILLVALAAGCVHDGQPPELLSFAPADRADLRGVGTVMLRVEYRDKSEVDVRFVVDRIEVGTAEPDCRENEPCRAMLAWPTEAFAPGWHEVAAVLEDAYGNTTEGVHRLYLDDVLAITRMRVTGIIDDAGTLEIEVYAFDESHAFIGCAGSRHGLDIVDKADNDYAIDAGVIDTHGLLFATGEVSTRAFRIEVWEDDDPPVCPVVPDPLRNDLVGRSPARTVAEWRAAGTTTFDLVTALEVAWVRDRSEPAPVDPDPDHDGNELGPGCASTPAPSSPCAVVLALLALMRGPRRAALR